MFSKAFLACEKLLSRPFICTMFHPMVTVKTYVVPHGYGRPKSARGGVEIANGVELVWNESAKLSPVKGAVVTGNVKAKSIEISPRGKVTPTV
jgi:hypothetical protein